MFIVPDVALSAGTILAMSGDAIMMDYFSCLGPIVPQVERAGKLVPALSYLEQFDRLVQRSRQGPWASEFWLFGNVESLSGQIATPQCTDGFEE